MRSDPLVAVEAAATFTAAVTALTGGPLGDAPFAVAVSGGPDSLALLLLAHAAFGHRVRALTVDHRLRPDSAAEATDVAAYAARLGVPHATLAWDGPHPATNRQAAARAARYRLMADWCAANGVRWLASAHHRDDAAETLLLRLARGSGSSGLAGIRARRDLGGVTLLRPLLGWSKADLAAVVAAAGWRAADDPSNRDAAFDRTRARALLAATPWLDPARLAASAAHLADAEAALAWVADRAWASRAEVAGDAVRLDAGDLPHDLSRRLLLRGIATLAPDATPRGPTVERLLARLAEGRGGTLAGIAVRVSPPSWRLSRAAPRRKP
ncbi:MAG: tRNA lysidine(34) synthetase TilS [Sphingomonadaceae bacterium]|nr:tRNA lysidine(34) synthetase TilS [Sphingomonadaceae bacterium]